METTKIFNIGLPKTGTHSLHTALQHLGYRSLHNPLELRQQSYEGRYRFDRDDWDALTNFGEHCYPQLDRAYPNSKFILTVREMDRWLDSYRRQIEASTGQEDAMRLFNRRAWYRPRTWRQAFRKQSGIDVRLSSLHVRLEIFGIYRFNAERCRYVYETHYNNALHHFRDRKKDLLILDVCRGDGWEKLCRFLGCDDVPDTRFPCEYVGPRVHPYVVSDDESDQADEG